MDRNRRDPFDRIIASIARYEDLPLVWSEGAFDAQRIRRLWD